jgi:hypothetical protein
MKPVIQSVKERAESKLKEFKTKKLAEFEEMLLSGS